MHRDGFVHLILISAVGDADLYVSSSTLVPDYNNYDIGSTTCGEDEVMIAAEMTRPVGIGVFGHPSYDISDFKLVVYADDNTVADIDLPHVQKQAIDTENDESLVWSIFFGVLKIIQVVKW